MGAIISTQNWADDAGATLSVITGTMTRPISEAQKPWGRGLARGAYGGTSIVVVRVDLGVARNIICLGAKGLNGTENDGVFRLSNVSAGGSELLDTSSEGDGMYYTDDWGLPFGNALWWVAPSSAIYARYVEMMLRSEVGTLSYLDLRRLWVGGGMIIPEGFDSGWSLDFVDSTKTDRSDTGGVFTLPGSRRRKLSATLTNRDESIVTASEASWPRITIGGSAEVVIAPRANENDSRSRYLQTIHGQLTGWSPIRYGRSGLIDMETFTTEEAPMPALS